MLVGFNEGLTGSLRHWLLMEVQFSQNYRVLVCYLDGSYYWRKLPQNFQSLAKVISIAWSAILNQVFYPLRMFFKTCILPDGCGVV